LSVRFNLLLDATPGSINIQQNNTIWTLSIVATIFLPPTPIASVFGINFQHMPWLRRRLGALGGERDRPLVFCRC
jgi:magnesium transporter